LVESEDRLDEVMDSLHRRIATPVLTKLKLEPSGLRFEPGSLVPSRLPDLFAGTPLFLFGRYQGEAKGGLTLQAADGLGRPSTQTIQATKTDNAALTVLWARGHVREMEDRYACGRGNATESSKQIVALSLKYGVLCRFTAFVAVDRSETVNAGGQQHRIIQPVDMPAGWEMPSAIGMARAAAPRSPAYMAALPLNEEGGIDLLCQADFGLSQTRARKSRAAPSTAKAQGKLNRRPRIGKSAPTQNVPDLAPYRRRAAELLELLGNKTTANEAERLTALTDVAMKLAELVADLKSVGADTAEIQPLEKLLTDLQHFLGGPSASGDLAPLWKEAEAVLQAFSGAMSATPATRRRESFWK
jgi:Ca-activated chloride channel family protein